MRQVQYIYERVYSHWLISSLNSATDLPCSSFKKWDKLQQLLNNISWWLNTIIHVKLYQSHWHIIKFDESFWKYSPSGQLWILPSNRSNLGIHRRQCAVTKIAIIKDISVIFLRTSDDIIDCLRKSKLRTGLVLCVIHFIFDFNIQVSSADYVLDILPGCKD